MALGRRSRLKRDKIDATRLGQDAAPDIEQPATSGPWDVTDVPADDAVGRLDLGPLRVPALDLHELRVEMTPEGQVIAVTLSGPAGEMQLGVFAAPRTDGIWSDVRSELVASVRSQGGKTRENDGDFGPEVNAEVRTPEGTNQLRFIGIDGPRWFLRAVVSGPAAGDADMFAPLAGALRDVVVDRGTEPMPVREPLPLRLPEEVAEQIGAQHQAAQDGAAAERE